MKCYLLLNHILLGHYCIADLKINISQSYIPNITNLPIILFSMSLTGHRIDVKMPSIMLFYQNTNHSTSIFVYLTLLHERKSLNYVTSLSNETVYTICCFVHTKLSTYHGSLFGDALPAPLTEPKPEARRVHPALSASLTAPPHSTGGASLSCITSTSFCCGSVAMAPVCTTCIILASI